MARVARRRFSVVRHGDNEIWRERTIWEGYERFGAVVTILKAKYGTRLRDVVPTEASVPHLLGDAIEAPGRVQQIRASLSLREPV